MIDVVNDPDYERYNPVRSLRWRWRRAQLLVARGCQFRRNRDDEITGLAVHYLRDRAGCRSNRRLRNLARRYPDLHAALRLHENGGLKRWEVEARILARQDSKEIGRLTALPTATIDLFEGLFFNVTDRLGARSYIVKSIGQVSHVEDSRAVFLRSIAYFGGPIVLDTVLKYPGALVEISAKECTSSATEPDLTRRIRLLMSAMTAEFDDRMALNFASIGPDFRASKTVRNGHVFAQEVAETLENVFRNMPTDPLDAKEESTVIDETSELGEAA